MMIATTVLTLAGLANGAGFLFVVPEPDAIRALNSHWRAYFLDSGVIEPDEANYYFEFREWQSAAANWEDHLSNRQALFDRQSQMDTDCPTLLDVTRLPPREWNQHGREINSRYQQYLRELSVWSTPAERDVIDLVLADTERRAQFLDLVWSAHYGIYGRGRRLALQDIRKLIGREDYLDSKWPDALPPSGYFGTYWLDFGRRK